MRIAMLGAGYVGLVSGVCFAEFGVHVTCIDKDSSKVDALKRGEIPIYEPDLEELVTKNINSGRLDFSDDITHIVPEVDMVFIAVGTPTIEETGNADLSYVFAAAREIAPLLRNYTVVVTKSTVPVGTSARVLQLLKEENPYADVDIASNPEFLREGSAVRDFMFPDRVIIGADSKRAQTMLQELYNPLRWGDIEILLTNPHTSELIKYTANSFLATKIAFINEISDMCEQVGADIYDVAHGIGLDPRIGAHFLKPGPGYGGSCLPKDTMALSHRAREAGTELRVLDAVIDSNNTRPLHMAQKVRELCGGSLEGKIITALGVTFKAGTDDARKSPAIAVMQHLQDMGATLRAYDPKGAKHAAREIAHVAWCDGLQDALHMSHCAVILTEWEEFTQLDFAAIGPLMAERNIADLRGIYHTKSLRAHGFNAYVIGKPYGK